MLGTGSSRSPLTAEEELPAVDGAEAEAVVGDVPVVLEADHVGAGEVKCLALKACSLVLAWVLAGLATRWLTARLYQ